MLSYLRFEKGFIERNMRETCKNGNEYQRKYIQKVIKHSGYKKECFENADIFLADNKNYIDNPNLKKLENWQITL